MMATTGVERPLTSPQRGMVLVIVLWIVTLLAVMAGGFAYSMRVETRLATTAVERAQATQPAAWATLSKNHGAAAEATLLDRLRKSLDDRGTLDVLRHGVELLGLRQPVALAQFKPALAMNPDTLARYGANRLRVVRQWPRSRPITTPPSWPG